MAVLAIVANIVDRLGLLGRVEKFLQDAGFAKGFKVDLSVLLRAAAGIGAGLVIVAVIATMLLGFFFNGVSGVLGGLVVTVLEERPPLPKTQPEPHAAPVNAEAVEGHYANAWDDTTTMWDGPTQSGPVAGTAV